MEILYCSDHTADVNSVARLLRTTRPSRLIKLLVVSKDHELPKQLPTLASYASLMVIRLHQTSKWTSTFLELALALALEHKLLLVVLIGETHLQNESYALSNVPSAVLDRLWQCHILPGAHALIKLLCKLLNSSPAIEFKPTCKPSKLANLASFKLRNIPLRYTDSNALICCYDMEENELAITQAIRRLRWARLRPIIFCVKNQLQSNWIEHYNRIQRRYSPKTILSVMCFCSIKSIPLNRTVIVQVAQSEKTLKHVIGDSIGLKGIELFRKVYLPETEGKLFTRVVNYSKPCLNLTHDTYVHNAMVLSNRINFVAASQTHWTRLKTQRPKTIYVLANYPPNDARIGNGVGLDTLASVVNINNILNNSFLPFNGGELINTLIAGVTNATNLNRLIRATISLSLAERQCDNRMREIIKEWGPLGLDAFVISRFCVVPALRIDCNVVGIQPTRGYGLINASICHSAFIVPCGFYYLSHLFYKRVYANALVVNIGKHGNLEWLPGRSIALSRWCYPEWISLGLISAYLYIVNDPGEGTQAKRRISAVIIDHDLPYIAEYTAIADWSGLGFDCYEELANKYICSLLDLQFKCKLHSWCELSLHELIHSTFVLNKGQISSRAVALSYGVDRWWCARYKWMACSELTRRVLLGECSALQTNDINVVMRLVSLRLASCFSELNSMAKVGRGHYIAPGLASSFSRPDDDVLPTGRNFYTKDVDKLPTPFAYNVGKAIAMKLMRRYYHRSCQWLKSVAINVWASANMRTGGDDIAVIMNLIGAKPIWLPKSLQVIGFEVIPLAILRHPRVSVLVRVSGLFRDTCMLTLTRLHKMFSTVAMLANEMGAPLEWHGSIFCCKPGLYGVGIQELLDGRSLPSTMHLAMKYMLYGSYCFNGTIWNNAIGKLTKALSSAQVVMQTQDNYEHDVLDSDDYYQFEGGLNAAVRYCRGKVCAYHVDTSRALLGSIKIRSLKHEIARMVTGKLLNKTWALMMLSNGYRGSVEILANLNYFCNLAVTTLQTSDSQFDAVNSLLMQDKTISSQLAKVNNAVYNAIRLKLFEASHYGIWHTSSNSLRLCLGS